MATVDLTVLWDYSPIPQLVMDRNTILEINAACLALLGYEHDDLIGKAGWEEQLFAEASQSYKFFHYLLESRRHYAEIEFRTRTDERLYLRVSRSLLDEERGLFLVALTDLTQIREDSEAMQAGYDEFVRVTTDLENALRTIEEQNRLLGKQRETLQNELNIARKVQSQLFTHDFSRLRMVRAAGFYEAMENLGGDMWEFYESDRQFLAVIGDVMGHGVAASLISIAAKTLFKKYFETLASDQNTFADLGAALSAINADMLEVTRGNYYVTAVVVRIDHTGRVEYITAGHPPLFLVGADAGQDAQGRLLHTSQPMLGIFPKVQYTAQEFAMRPGDRMLLYTDCLLESVDPQGNQLDLRHVAGLVRATPDNSPEEAVRRILDFREKHTGLSSLPDDLALVCIELPV